MDYHSQLKRFLHRRVCVDLWGRSTVWGTLASIADDHLRLVDTIIVGELEGQGWFERMNYGQDDSVSGPRNAETIVRIEVVLHITYADDDLPEPPMEDRADSNTVDGDSGSTNRIQASPSELIAGMAELQHAVCNGPENSSEQEQAITVRADRLEIELGIGLIQLVSPTRGGELLERIDRIRKQIAAEMGVILPPVRVKDCLALDSSIYRVRVNGHIVASGELMADRLLAMNLNDSTNSIEGIDAIEPAYGLPARWIEPKLQEELFRKGGSVADPATVLATHLAHAVRDRLHELISYQDVWQLVDDLRAGNGNALTDLVPSPVSLSILHRLLMSLLEERVSIRQLMTIIESVAYHASQTTDHAQLLQRLRVDIGREICAPLVGDDGQLHVIKLDETIEQTIHLLFVARENLTQHQVLLALAQSVSLAPHNAAILVHRAELRRSIFTALSRQGQYVTVFAEVEVPCDLLLTHEEAPITSP